MPRTRLWRGLCPTGSLLTTTDLAENGKTCCDLLSGVSWSSTTWHGPTIATSYSTSTSKLNRRRGTKVASRLQRGSYWAHASPSCAPEFRVAHKKVHPRGGAVRRLLVFMGGMDAGNATGTVLQAIALTAQRGLALDIVIGTSHPAREAIAAFCAAWPRARCHVQTDQMANLLARCDLAIGAGGGATWERCCLGVPTLALALADNQRTQLGALAAAGLAYVPDDPQPEAVRLSSHLLALLDNSSLRRAMSEAGMALVDGRGAERVSSTMIAGLLRLRPAVPGDSARILEWRNAPRVREMSLDNTEISAPLHERWFEQVLAASDRVLLIGEDDAGPAGVVRFDLSEGKATISIYLAQERFGQGLGPGLLRAAEDWLAVSHPEILWVHAQVQAVNAASLHLFEQGGYCLDSYHFSRKIQA